MCGEPQDNPYSDGLCSVCTYRELVKETNSLCATCKKKCKQTALISIATCPDYVFKKPSDAQKQPLAASSPAPSVKTSKKPKTAKKALKAKKRKVK